MKYNSLVVLALIGQISASKIKFEDDRISTKMMNDAEMNDKELEEQNSAQIKSNSKLHLKGAPADKSFI